MRGVGTWAAAGREFVFLWEGVQGGHLLGSCPGAALQGMESLGWKGRSGQGLCCRGHWRGAPAWRLGPAPNTSSLTCKMAVTEPVM